MASMNGSGESARKPAHQTTNDAAGKHVGYESPLPQLLAAIDAVTGEIKGAVETTRSQRLATYALWFLQKVAYGVKMWAPNADHAPHPRQLDQIGSERDERESTGRFPRSRKRRRLRRFAPTNPDIVYHLGGARHEGETWAPAPAITEASGHPELLLGLDNLHRFIRTIAANNPERAKAAVREYGRVVALLLGATRTEWNDGLGNILRAGHHALRNWDILKAPRAPAPGLQLPCQSVPIFDAHSVLDTGVLQISLIAHWIGEGIYDEKMEQLRQLTNGDEAEFQAAMEVLAFAKVSPADEQGTPHDSIGVFHHPASGLSPANTERARSTNSEEE